MKTTSEIAAYNASPIATSNKEPIELRYLPESIGMIATLRKAFWQNTHHLYPNRILVTEKFATALCRELAQALGIPLFAVKKPIVKPGTMVFNMRIHVVPDNFMALPCEVSFAQELDLPGYTRQYMTSEQTMLMEFERRGYTTYDFSNSVKLPQP